MLSAKKRRAVAKKIEKVVQDKYGEPKRRKVRPAIDHMVQSILWRYTSVRRGTRALRQLKRTVVDWNEVRVSPVVEIASTMANTDWAEIAAQHIKKVLESIFELRNVVDLEFLHELTTAQARAFLQSIHEVPRDLADEVLLFGLEADLLPVGDDTARMCFRLGLIKNNRATLKNQKALMKLWSPEYYVGVTLFFHDHAAEVCLPVDPAHSDCPLKRLCPKEGL